MNIKTLKLTKRQRAIIVILTAAAIITAVSVMLALLGSRVYKSSADSKSTEGLCAVSQYLIHQVRSCDSSSQLRVAYLGGSLPALVISTKDSKGDSETETWFFTYNGSLCKTTAEPGSSVSETSGQAVAELETADFHITQENLLEITLINDAGDSITVNTDLTGKGGSNHE